jgi:hypothetical protein
MPIAFRDQPGWVFGLSNAALLAAFGAAYDAREARADARQYILQTKSRF